MERSQGVVTSEVWRLMFWPQGGLIFHLLPLQALTTGNQSPREQATRTPNFVTTRNRKCS